MGLNSKLLKYLKITLRPITNYSGTSNILKLTI
jgi:hypothetical protein